LAFVCLFGYFFLATAIATQKARKPRQATVQPTLTEVAQILRYLYNFALNSCSITYLIRINDYLFFCKNGGVIV